MSKVNTANGHFLVQVSDCFHMCPTSRVVLPASGRRSVAHTEASGLGALRVLCHFDIVPTIMVELQPTSLQICLADSPANKELTTVVLVMVMK